MDREGDGNTALPKISLLVTDLDNTLWDWVEMWYRSFSALLNGIERISAIPRDELLPEIREVHQRRRTSEYSYLIGELASLKRLHGAADLQLVYGSAIEAARDARIGALRLYPGVLDSLNKIKERGATIAAYTESLEFWTSYRIKKLHLDGVIDYVYSPPDHDFPAGMSAGELRTRGSEKYRLARTKHRETPSGVLKPSPEILTRIISEVGGSGGVAYVGDNLQKDIVMAKDVGVVDVWAEYGVAQHRDEYALLRHVSHWMDEAVEKERDVEVQPTITLHESFAELFDHFEFVTNDRR